MLMLGHAQIRFVELVSTVAYRLHHANTLASRNVDVVVDLDAIEPRSSSRAQHCIVECIDARNGACSSKRERSRCADDALPFHTSRSRVQLVKPKRSCRTQALSTPMNTLSSADCDAMSSPGALSSSATICVRS